MTDTPRRRVVVVGLDGATLDVIRPLVQAGRLPTLARLMQDGAHGELTTTIPPVTAPAWTSFMTGKNPGKHGLFDFMRRRSDTYFLTPVDSRSRAGRTVWDLIGDAGKRVVVMNVPVTYPPSRVNGDLITGMLTPPSQEDYTYPPELKDEIEREIGEFIVYPREVYAKGKANNFMGHLRFTLEQRLKVVLRLMRTRDWDFFMVVFPETDTVQHGMTGTTDPQHPGYDHQEHEQFGDAINQIYEQADAALAQIMAELRDDDTLIVMSDHGFGPLYRFMYVNNFLADIGALRFRRNPISLAKRLVFKLGLTVKTAYSIALAFGLGKLRRTMDKRRGGYKMLRRFFLSFADVDWKRSQAYAAGYIGQVFVNTQGREPQGCVAPGEEYQRVRAEIVEKLRQLKDPADGAPLISEIHLKEDIYSGPYLEDAPDIVFFPRDLETIAFGDFEFPSNKLVEPAYAISGHHRMDGVLFVRGPGVKPGVTVDGATIIDVTPTILYNLDLPVPDDMDGQVLKAAYATEVFERKPITFSKGEDGSKVTDSEYTEEDQKEIEERLRSLGYLS
jgi:predicted AlkP superfamily phosphohydrolase/phosphomutase